MWSYTEVVGLTTIIYHFSLVYMSSQHLKRPLCPWLYGSWIYNYLCNQCISPLKLWVRIPVIVGCTRNKIIWLSLPVKRVSRYQMVMIRIRKRTDNTMAKKGTKGQTTIYKTLHRKLQIEQHETKLKTEAELMWLRSGRWFSPDTPVSTSNKTERHDITEILLKVALQTTTSNHLKI